MKKKDKEPKRDIPFRRAGVYANKSEAMSGERGPDRERLAAARLKALKLGAKVHKGEQI